MSALMAGIVAVQTIRPRKLWEVNTHYSFTAYSI